MHFASDNTAGASPKIAEALIAANSGTAAAYGNDDLTAAVERRLSAVFERDVAAFLVATGTAANALSIAALSPAWGAVFCHRESHLMIDECGAPEFYSGAKLVGIGGDCGKLTPAAVAATFDEFLPGFVHQVQPAVLSLTQATEAGTVYSASEIAALVDSVRPRGLAVHMDGARFANAVAALGVAPADITWRAGVDALSLGATKNGAFLAEAVIFFDKARAENFGYLRKRAGQLISKGRFVAAQFDAWLTDDHWLDLARHANAMAARLGAGIAAAPNARLACPVEANEVFAILPAALDKRLRGAGAAYHPWAGHGLSSTETAADEVLVRLVASFATTADDVDQFIALLNEPG